MNQRNSSVELFRILATFLVLIVHFNGWFVGMPATFSGEYTTFIVSQAVIEGLSAVCVNCFLVISGFYGMKLKLRSVWNIYVLLLFIYVPFYLMAVVVSGNFSIYTFLINFTALGRESYFVQCYLMLLFLSPILNSFIESYGKGTLKYVLCFALIAFFWDCILNNKCLAFGHGYSLTHFVLLYLLGRMTYLYKDELLKIPLLIYLCGYFTSGGVMALLYLLGVDWAYYYTNPINIVGAFCLFLAFLHRQWYNATVNWIAGSTFAVYIMHTCSPLIGKLRYIDNWILQNHTYPIYLLLIAGVIIAVFVACILYDKIRVRLFSPITDRIFIVLNNRLSKFKLLN